MKPISANPLDRPPIKTLARDLSPAPGSVMPCGCPVADIPITLALEGLEGPEAVQGYTCKCGRCFYPEPRSPNSYGRS